MMVTNWSQDKIKNAADALFKQIIALHPDSPQAHWGLSGSGKASDASHIATMQTLQAHHSKDPRGSAFYCYAIGKEREDLEQWDAAFEAFSAGAAARRATVEFDESTEIAMFDYLEEHYTSDWLDSKKDFYKSPLNKSSKMVRPRSFYLLGL